MCFEMMRIDNVKNYIGRSDTIIVDLREKEQYDCGHIAGAVNIPYEQGMNLRPYVCGYQYVLLYCQRGAASMMAAKELRGIDGYVINLCNGIKDYTGNLVKS